MSMVFDAMERDGEASRWYAARAIGMKAGLGEAEAGLEADRKFGEEYPEEWAGDGLRRKRNRETVELASGGEDEADVVGEIEELIASGGKTGIEISVGNGPNFPGVAPVAKARGNPSGGTPTQVAPQVRVSTRQAFEWVFENFGRKGVEETDAPSHGAWMLLKGIETNDDLKRDFYRQCAQRMMSVKESERERYRDDNRELKQVINDLIEARGRAIRPVGAARV